MTKAASIDKNQYKAFLCEVKTAISEAQNRAIYAVNKELVTLYWNIGKMIADKQDSLGWGESVVESLSKDIQAEFPTLKGFSTRNMWKMRQLYQEYSKSEKLPPLVAEISWTKHLVILEKCKNGQEIEFYIQMTKKFGWSKSLLDQKIRSEEFERFLLNQTNFDLTIKDEHKNNAILAVKDEYNFNFVQLEDNHSEKELELQLVNNIRRFLLEMGGDFAFIGNQYRIQIGDSEYILDLLLYHRRLRALIVLELKTTAFKPEYAGKMMAYLSALNETMKYEGENDAIGIIVCQSKDRTLVEYTLKDVNKPIGVAQYSQKKKLPEKLKAFLPSPEDIAEKLQVFQDKLPISKGKKH